jgi:hypothetical protein
MYEVEWILNLLSNLHVDGTSWRNILRQHLDVVSCIFDTGRVAHLGVFLLYTKHQRERSVGLCRAYLQGCSTDLFGAMVRFDGVSFCETMGSS